MKPQVYLIMVRSLGVLVGAVLFVVLLAVLFVLDTVEAGRRLVRGVQAQLRHK